jgi:small ubiquitin-related modifier
MQKVFDTYAARKGVQASSLRFLLDGEKILPDQTPKMLELDDQDQIDCMLEQTGGGKGTYSLEQATVLSSS